MTIYPMNYAEIPVADLAAAKAFYSAAFGWTFTDYGPSYASIDNAGLDGGLDASGEKKPSADGAMIILLSDDLLAAQNQVEAAGAKISKPVFDFPGGSRFQLLDPFGNELAVWAKRDN